MTMVDKVAMALAYDVRPPTTEFEDMPIEEYWRRLKDEGGDAETFMGQARTALEALKEPSDAILDAIQNADLTVGASITKAWQAIIDAALNEKNPPTEAGGSQGTPDSHREE